MDQDSQSNKGKVGFYTAVVASALIAFGMSPETAEKFVGEVVTHEIAQAGFFFTLAALIHARQVRKEIRSQFEFLTTAINSVATALKQDIEVHTKTLEAQSSRLKTVENGFDELRTGLTKAHNRIDKLETKGG